MVKFIRVEGHVLIQLSVFVEVADGHAERPFDRMVAAAVEKIDGVKSCLVESRNKKRGPATNSHDVQGFAASELVAGLRGE